MFLFRWLWKLIFWGLVVFGLWWAANYKVDGRPLYQVVKSFIASDDFSQSWKDMKMFAGGFLKSLGEEIQENMTEEDKKALEKMIQKKAREKNGNDGF